MTEEQIHILRHATGADSKKPGYRNSYCTEADNADCLSLVKLGLMRGPLYPSAIPEGYSYFFVTAKGFKLLGFKEQK